jgi:hypothetical protein
VRDAAGCAAKLRKLARLRKVEFELAFERAAEVGCAERASI